MSSVMPPVATDVLAGETYAFPTSLAQQRIWFYSQLALQSPFYNIPLRFRLTGRLDSNLLAQSIEDIVARHETLRTAVASIEGQPRQIVSASSQAQLRVVDLSAALHPEQELLQLETKEAQAPFDLNNGPLFRCTLVRLGEEEHELLLTMHHIIADGWSVGVFVRDLTEIYGSYVSGVEPNLGDLGIQYADYAIWQHEWVESTECQTQLEYWRRQLDGLSPLPLLTDRPRPSEQSFRGGHQAFALDRKLSDKLRSFSDSQGVTIFMTLLAGFQTLLYRYTDSQDIAVGSPIANRNREELERLIGFFANTVVLRNEFNDELTFVHLLQRVKESTLLAYANQDLPFDKLVDELQPERATNRNPLFQVVFALQNAPVDELDLAGVKLSSPSSAGRSDIFDSLALLSATRFDLELHLWDQAEGICGGFLYSTDLFDQSTIRRMSEHLRVLLEGIVRDPAQRLRDLPLIAPAERELLVNGWNQTATDYPKDTAIHALFEEQSRRTPNAIAVTHGDDSLSYQELNERANQLAHYLVRSAAGEEILVGVMLKRSVDLIVALLGILKAGGAYVPLDPAYPTERLRFMIADTGITNLITNDSFRDLWSDLPLQAVSLDGERELIATESRDDASLKATGNNLAYVMYTSGSTGTPKGVCVEHRAVVRLVKNTNYVTLNEETVMLQFAPVSFDASTLEIWGALLNGGRIVVFGAENPSLAEIGAEVKKREVNTMWLTAGLFHLMVDER
ncbi:MAG TPA: condensation domain-containing protein, partial [Pyrinomonadaceae bacterium]|nr:condensation domain-containing protein [Pyrinomonadaceae bacterium]